MLFALVQVLLNQQIVVLQPWLCGSVDLTANENKHHEEEAWSNFCCSLLLVHSLHSSGYIQEGQGVNHDYLLLGVCYRNSPSCTHCYKAKANIKSTKYIM